MRAQGHRNVYRVERGSFHGWRVSLKRQGRRVSRLFGDRGEDPDLSLARALAWRDQVVAQLPPPRKFRRTSRVNKTGVVGVILQRARTRSGRLFWHYAAVWTDETGRKHKRTFSIAKYGAARARQFAVKTREDAIAEMLRTAPPYGARQVPTQPSAGTEAPEAEARRLP